MVYSNRVLSQYYLELEIRLIKIKLPLRFVDHLKFLIFLNNFIKIVLKFYTLRLNMSSR